MFGARIDHRYILTSWRHAPGCTIYASWNRLWALRGRVYATTYACKGERKRRREIRPRLRGVWITLESGQAFVNGVSTRIWPPDIGQPGHLFYLIRAIPLTWVAVLAMISWRGTKNSEQARWGTKKKRRRRWITSAIDTLRGNWALHVACCNDGGCHYSLQKRSGKSHRVIRAVIVVFRFDSADLIATSFANVVRLTKMHARIVQDIV